MGEEKKNEADQSGNMNQSADREKKNEAVQSGNMNQSDDREKKNEAVQSGNMNQSVDREKKNEAVQSGNMNQPVDREKKNVPFHSGSRNQSAAKEKKNEQVPTGNRNQSAAKEKKNEQVPTGNRNQSAVKDKKNAPVNTGNKNQSAAKDNKNESVQTMNRDQSADKDKNHTGNRRRRYPRRTKSYHGSQQNRPPQLKKVSFKRVSVVIPLLNEEESIVPLTQEIKNAFTMVSSDYEIIFIDDGSTDNSLNVIKNLSNSDKNIKYCSFQKNYGKSAALQIGFKRTTGSAIITMDADLQDDPSEIPNLLMKLDEGYDLVSGWKKHRQDPFIKKHSSKFFNYATRIMSGIKIHDFNCGLKAYRAEVVKRINVYGELHRYMPVLANWEGFTVTEIPVKHHPRRYGKTKFGISRFYKGFVDLITVIFTTRYIKRPMHLFGLIGAFSFLIGVLLNLYISIEWFMGVPIKNRPLLSFGILLIIVGVQFFAVGLLGELVAHNYQNDNEYNIKEKK